MKVAPPLSTGDARQPENVDALLRSFFQSEMPEPWPAMPALPRQVRPAGHGLIRSRLALAASIALLVGGAMAMPVQLRRESSANLPRMLPGIAEKFPLTEDPVQPKPGLTDQRIPNKKDAHRAK